MCQDPYTTRRLAAEQGKDYCPCPRLRERVGYWSTKSREEGDPPRVYAAYLPKAGNERLLGPVPRVGQLVRWYNRPPLGEMELLDEGVVVDKMEGMEGYVIIDCRKSGRKKVDIASAQKVLEVVPVEP